MTHLDYPHVMDTGRLQIAVSAKTSWQQWRGRGGDGWWTLTMLPGARPPEPHLDVQQRVRDVEPGVEVRDVIGAGCLQSCVLNSAI